MVVFTYLHIEASFNTKPNVIYKDRECIDLVNNISDVVVKVSVKC